MTNLWDAIVIGAGPAGSAASIRLAREGLKVLLLDKQDFPRDKTCGDALSPEAMRHIEELGVVDQVASHGFWFNGITVTTPAGLIVGADADPLGNIGYVMRRFELDDRLRSAAVASGAEFVGDVRVTRVNAEEGTVVGNSAGVSRAWHGRVIVLAVGANLGLLRELGLLPRRSEFASAARLYYTTLPKQSHEIHFRFDGVPMPGYGWIFPLSETEANVGVALFGGHRTNVYGVLKQFLQHPSIAAELAGGIATEKMKAYPLRLDFHRSPLRRGRLLTVGEAAGLVNPISGEGIDFALESGVLAGDCLYDCLCEGDFTDRALMRYERRLRARFQRFFVQTHWMRRAYMNERMLNGLGRASARWPGLPRLFADILQARQPPLRAFAPGVVLRVLRRLPTTA